MLFFVSVHYSVVAQDRYEVVSQSKLNVRSLPGTDSWVLGVLAPNEKIIVYHIDGDWAEIKYNNQTAYISAKYIKKLDDEKDAGVYRVISQSRLNVRNLPSMDSQILGTLQPEDEIDVLSIEGQWAKIQYLLNVGYVALKYIEKVEQTQFVENDVVEVPAKKEETPSKPVDKSPKRCSKKVSFKNIGMEFVPNLSIGYANFTCSSVYPVPTMGLGIDCALQFIAKEKISFVPKNYFTEASLGYSMRGSGAFPMHYFNIKLTPFGYRLVRNNYAFWGKLGAYVGFSASEVKTQYNYFYTNPDVGLSVGMGAEMHSIGVGISFEQGFIDVCDANLSLKNQCVFANLSYRFNVKKEMFRSDREKKEKKESGKSKTFLNKKLFSGSFKKNKK